MKMETLRRVTPNLLKMGEQAERGDQTLRLLAENWCIFVEDTILEIMWLGWRGSVGHREYVPYVETEHGEAPDGHVYLSDGSIPTDEEFLDNVKKFRP